MSNTGGKILQYIQQVVFRQVSSHLSSLASSKAGGRAAEVIENALSSTLKKKGKES